MVRLLGESANGRWDGAVHELLERVADPALICDVKQRLAGRALLDVLLRGPENPGHRCAVRKLGIGRLSACGAHHRLRDPIGVLDSERRSDGCCDSIENLANGC